MNFTRNLIILSALLLAGLFAYHHLTPVRLHSPHAYFIVLYFFILTFFMHRYVIAAGKRSAQASIRAFMGSVSLRMLLHMALILTYGLLNRPGAVVFIAAFIPIFIIYLIFEAAALRQALKS